MKIKQFFSELFLAKTRVRITNFIGNEKSMSYTDMGEIKYCPHRTGAGGGYIRFFSKTGKSIEYNFASAKNDEIEDAVQLIRRIYPNISIDKEDVGQWPFYKKDSGKSIEYNFASAKNDEIEDAVQLIRRIYPNISIDKEDVGQWPFYKKDFFIFIMALLFFPVSIFLMWYHKKYGKPVRITFTALLMLFFVFNIYNFYKSWHAVYNGYVNQIIEMQTIIESEAEKIEDSITEMIEEPEKGHTEITQYLEGEVYESDKVSIMYLETGDYTEENQFLQPDGGIEEPEKGHTEITQYLEGEVYESDKVSIMYLETGDYTEENQFLQPDGGNKYIYIDLSIQNVGEDDLIIGNASFNCYADDIACSQSVLSTDGSMDAISTLSSGKYLQGKIYYEVPENASNIIVEYKPDILKNERINFVIK